MLRFDLAKYSHFGGVAEWLNAHVSKTCMPVRASGVRILPPPPSLNPRIYEGFYIPLCRFLKNDKL